MMRAALPRRRIAARIGDVLRDLFGCLSFVAVVMVILWGGGLLSTP